MAKPKNETPEVVADAVTTPATEDRRWLTTKQLAAFANVPIQTARNAIKLRAEFHNYDASGVVQPIDADPASLARHNSRYRPDDSVDYNIVEVAADAAERWIAALATGQRQTPNGARRWIVRLDPAAVEAFDAWRAEYNARDGVTTIPALEVASKPKTKTSDGAATADAGQSNGDAGQTSGDGAANSSGDAEFASDGTDTDLFGDVPTMATDSEAVAS